MRCPSGRSTSGGLAAIRNFGRTVCSASKTTFRQAAVPNAARPIYPKTNRPRTAPRRKPEQEKCMYTKDAIRYSLNLADQAVMRSLETIEDAPLTFPTENGGRSEEHTSELQSLAYLVCRLLLEKKKK